MTRHLSRPELLRHLDGEMSSSGMRKAAEHLQACWSCQAEFGRLKEQISTILDAQNTAFGPSLPPPPNAWPRLEPRLEQASRAQRPPFWMKLVSTTGISPRAQLVYAGVATAVAVVTLLLWSPVPPVSAHEVLRRSAAADSRRLAINGQQVIKQRVRVKKTTRGGAPLLAAPLQSWKSVKSIYWEAADLINSELADRYKSSGLAAELPLSPTAVESWVRVAGSEPSTSEDRESVNVQVLSNSEGRTRGLEEVSLHVERRNWHLDQMTLTFTDAMYQITEEESSVIAKGQIPGDVLAKLEPPEAPAAPNPGPPPIASVPPPAGVAVNLDDLEMEVRYSLHGIGADLGDRVEVSARQPDRVLVNAQGASPQMREKLLALLANKPGVQLELQSPAGGGPGGRVTRIIPPAAGSGSQPDRRLLTSFGSAEALENYTRSVLEASSKVLSRLYALANLAGRWTPDLEARLSPSAKSSLDLMIRDHSREVRDGITDLGKQLTVLWNGSDYAAPAVSPQPGVKWQDAGAAGLQAVQQVDRVLRSLLTTSDTPISLDEALPQLQRSLSDLDRAGRELPGTAQ